MRPPHFLSAADHEPQRHLQGRLQRGVGNLIAVYMDDAPQGPADATHCLTSRMGVSRQHSYNLQLDPVRLR